MLRLVFLQPFLADLSRSGSGVQIRMRNFLAIYVGSEESLEKRIGTSELLRTIAARGIGDAGQDKGGTANSAAIADDGTRRRACGARKPDAPAIVFQRCVSVVAGNTVTARID